MAEKNVDHFGRRTITVDGHKVVFDTKTHFPIGTDLSNEMAALPALMAWWGSVWASAAGEKIKADAHYRAWRAKRVDELSKPGAPKLTEEQRKAKIESDPQFIAFKSTLATAEENEMIAKGAFLALDKKGNLLQSRGANARAVYQKTGLATSKPRDEGTDPGDDEEEETGAPTAGTGERLFTEADDEELAAGAEESAASSSEAVATSADEPDPAKIAKGLANMKAASKAKHKDKLKDG